MAKLSYRPIDMRPPVSGGAMALRVFGLVMVSAVLLAMIYLLLQYSYSDEKQPWGYDPNRIEINFLPIRSEEEWRQEFERRRQQELQGQGVTELDPSQVEEMPRREPGQGLPVPGRDPFDPAPLPGPSDAPLDREAQRQVELARGQLTRPRVFDIAQESRQRLDWLPLRDDDEVRAANEFTANQGRQAGVYELVALQIMRRISGADLSEHVASGAYFWGNTQAAADEYRGHAFIVEGRLFDLFEQRPREHVVLPTGERIDHWYVGAVALLDAGIQGEYPIEHRVVLFKLLELPEELRPWLGEADGVSHQDRLATEHVMVSLTGAYYRRWVYSREVKPFSVPARRVMTQAFAPLLLASQLSRSERGRYELSRELLHQVRDSLREDPIYLETEGAYYAMLAQANDPDDLIEPMREISYFDLAGPETGPRYRGQGVHINGMIGQDYRAIILPPNISGLRRVYRAFVVDDRVDMASESRYLLDMIEPPTGLEPLAMVRFNARYYRNVFEMRDARSQVRPLLIVREARPYMIDDSGNWLYAMIGISGVIGMMLVLAWFVLSDRRERRAFEQSQLELTRKRLEKRGGLKLKPLPKKEGPES